MTSNVEDVPERLAQQGSETDCRPSYCVNNLTSFAAEPTVKSNRILKNRRRLDKRKEQASKKRQFLDMIFNDDHQQGESSQVVYKLDTDEENSRDNRSSSLLEDEFVFDEVDDIDDLMISNWKQSSLFCRSVSKRTKPKVKPHQRFKVSANKKLSQTKQNITENACARKINIQKKLDKLELVRFGNEIYLRRCHANEVHKTRTRQFRSCLGYSKRTKDMTDHPNALKYELKRDDIDKTYRMNPIADLQHRDITPEDFELLLMLDESVVPKTVSEIFLQSLTVIVVEEDKLFGELCSICMEVYQLQEMAKQLPCSHMFHVKCIDNWLSNASPNCPLDGVSVETH